MNEYSYIPVRWPESQVFIGMDHCHLINDEEGYKEFGDSAYFVREDVYDDIMKDKEEYNGRNINNYPFEHEI